jgi:hypothetical protein
MWLLLASAPSSGQWHFTSPPVKALDPPAKIPDLTCPSVDLSCPGVYEVVPKVINAMYVGPSETNRRANRVCGASTAVAIHEAGGIDHFRRGSPDIPAIADTAKRATHSRNINSTAGCGWG